MRKARPCPDYCDCNLCLIKKLEACLKAMVAAVEQDEEAITDPIWDGYKNARLVLGDPIVFHPGGYEGEHFHLFGWQEADGCSTCADWQAEQAVSETADVENGDVAR